MAGNQPTFKDLLTDVMVNYVNEVIRYPQSPYTKSVLTKYFSGQPMTPEEAMWISQNATSDYDVHHTMAYYRRLLDENADNLQKYSAANQNNPVPSPDVSAATAYASRYARPQSAPAAPQLVVPPVAAVPAAAPVAAPAAAPVSAPVSAPVAPAAAAPVVAPASPPPPPPPAPIAASPSPAVAPVAAAPAPAVSAPPAPVAAAPAAPAPWSVGDVTPQMIQSRAQQSSLDARIVEMFASARPEELALFTAAAKFINTGETPEDPVESQNMFNYMQSDDPLWTSYVEKNYGDPLRFYNETASAENSARKMEYSEDVVTFDPEISRGERRDQRVYLDQKEQNKRLNRRQEIESRLQGQIDFGVQQGSGEEFYSPSGTEAQNAAQSAIQKINAQSNLNNKVAAVQSGSNVESQQFYPEVQSETSRQLAALAQFVRASFGNKSASSGNVVPTQYQGAVYSPQQGATNSASGSQTRAGAPAAPFSSENIGIGLNAYRNSVPPVRIIVNAVPDQYSRYLLPPPDSSVNRIPSQYESYAQLVPNPSQDRMFAAAGVANTNGYASNWGPEIPNQQEMYKDVSTPDQRDFRYVPATAMYTDVNGAPAPVPDIPHGEYSVLQNPTRWSGFDINAKVESQYMYPVSQPSGVPWGEPQAFVSSERMYPVDTGAQSFTAPEDMYGMSSPSVYGPPQTTISQEKMYSIDTGSEFVPYASSEDVYGASRPSVYGPPQNTVSQEKMYFPESTGNIVLPLSERLRILSNTVSSGEAQYGYSSGWGVPQSRLSSEETYFAANRSALPSWNDTANAPQDTMYEIPFGQEKKSKPAYEKKPELGQPGEYGNYMREMDRNTRPEGPSFGWKDDPEYADAINNDRTFTQPGPKETMRLREDVPDYRGRATNSSMQRYRGAASDPAYAEEINRDAIPVVPVPQEPQNNSGATRWGGAAQLLRNTQPPTRRPTKWGGY